MGDGAKNNKGLVLCTDSFTIQEVVKLMNVLKIKFNIHNTTIQGFHNNSCILRKCGNAEMRSRAAEYICTSSSAAGAEGVEKDMSKFINIIKPHILSSMWYKFNL